MNLRSASLPALLAMAVLFSPARASADDAPEPANIAGLWEFVANITDGCTFSGQASLERQDDEGDFSCELTARQSCPEIDVNYLVRQTCQATRTGEQISVRSAIEEFLEGPPTGNYFPDNFSLFIQDSSHMNGALISGSSAYHAVWTRPEGGIS